MHPRLTEILRYLAGVRAGLAATVDSASPQALSTPSPTGGWSGAQILAHLGIVEGATTKMFEAQLGESMSRGLRADTATASLLGMLDHLRVTDRSVRVEAPARVHPPATVDPAEAWQSLQEARRQTLAAVDRADGHDLTLISWPHPLFGPLDGYKWILIIGQHEERHHAQLRETLGR